MSPGIFCALLDQPLPQVSGTLVTKPQGGGVFSRDKNCNPPGTAPSLDVWFQSQACSRTTTTVRDRICSYTLCFHSCSLPLVSNHHTVGEITRGEVAEFTYSSEMKQETTLFLRPIELLGVWVPSCSAATSISKFWSRHVTVRPLRAPRIPTAWTQPQ